MSAHPAPTRPPSDSARERPAEAGFILVTVLWILVALAGLTGVYATYLATTATAAAVRGDDIQAEGLALAAVELAALRLANTPRDQRPTRGEISLRMGPATIGATFTDETARIDLNAAPKELLAGLFTTLGAKPDDAALYAERILAWRATASGDAAEPYREARLDYDPRGAAFVHIAELWRVAGLPPELVRAALPHLTIYSGKADVNGADADPVVRAALDTLANPATAPGTPAPPPTHGDTARVRVQLVFDSGRSRAVEAVILLREFHTEPYRILSWQESDDFAPPAPARVGPKDARP